MHVSFAININVVATNERYRRLNIDFPLPGTLNLHQSFYFLDGLRLFAPAMALC
jgi:hypothetical protein